MNIDRIAKIIHTELVKSDCFGVSAEDVVDTITTSFIDALADDLAVCNCGPHPFGERHSTTCPVTVFDSEAFKIKCKEG